MQTFLPFPDFTKSAACLDTRRLGKQRVEAWQILQTLQGKSTSWQRHPAVLMWGGHEDALTLYGVLCCLEWRRRGYEDTMLERFNFDLDQEIQYLSTPTWLGNPDFHRSHQSNLLWKFPEYYLPIFGYLPLEPYVWPVRIRG